MNSKVKVGVGVIILNSDNKILLGLRRGSHGANTWGLPGGHVDFGETLEEAAVREVNEETNLKLENLKLVSIADDIMLHEGKHYISVGFVSKKYSGTLTIKEKEKCLQWKWFAPDALPDNIFIPSKHVIDNYRKDIIYLGGK